MTELMKRYEAETDEIATWSWHNKEFVTDDVLDWASEKIQALDVENTQLKAQLTWRSAINEPPENEGQQLCRWSWQDNCHFRNYDLRFGWGNVTEKEIKDLLWLPIPKEATDD